MSYEIDVKRAGERRGGCAPVALIMLSLPCLAFALWAWHEVGSAPSGGGGLLAGLDVIPVFFAALLFGVFGAVFLAAGVAWYVQSWIEGRRARTAKPDIPTATARRAAGLGATKHLASAHDDDPEQPR